MRTVIESDKVNKDIITRLYSDINYIPGDSLKYLEKETDDIRYYRPDYVFILGDLVGDAIYDLKQLRDLLEMISKMTKYTKVILVLGKNEQVTKKITGNAYEYYNLDLIHALKNIGVTILTNEFYQDNNLCIYGTHFPGMYYEEKQPEEYFIKTIQNIKFKNNDKFNILLEHSSKNTFDGYSMELLPNVDLVLSSSYNKNKGYIPWQLKNLIPSEMGILNYSSLDDISKNIKGERQLTDNCYGVIATPVTPISTNSKILRKVNKLLAPKNQEVIIRKK